MLVYRTFAQFLGFCVQYIVNKTGAIDADVLLNQELLEGFVGKSCDWDVIFDSDTSDFFEDVLGTALANECAKGRSCCDTFVIEIGDFGNSATYLEMHILIDDGKSAIGKSLRIHAYILHPQLNL